MVFSFEYVGLSPPTMPIIASLLINLDLISIAANIRPMMKLHTTLLEQFIYGLYPQSSFNHSDLRRVVLTPLTSTAKNCSS
jgi:hypothetical protein